MEFGRVELEELDSIDFSLPADRPETEKILSSATPNRKTEFYVGCAKWGRKDWVGQIYPKGTKEADFLKHYAKHFNSIELNATFYRIPTQKQTSSWKNKVGDGFHFCPKFSDSISHIRRLKDAQEVTDRFLDGISGFGNTLGPVFLMPHPGMGPKTLDVIEAFIEALPKDIRLFVELRHKDWFGKPESFSSLFDMLEKRNVGSVITDASGRRDCVHMRLTTKEAFIRFVGNGLHPTDYKRVDEWIQRIRTWTTKGIERIYFFMHQHEEIYSPILCRYVIQQLNRYCNAGLPEPVFISDKQD